MRLWLLLAFFVSLTAITGRYLPVFDVSCQFVSFYQQVFFRVFLQISEYLRITEAATSKLRIS